ncbi:MAG: HD-GYP domain-containing protein [Candidatus Loosdrechtia sp.]|uniref:HD-GYP domain-containing protein n=1 Tax=Candidatus Loosdrechtia sp. TaxID=3101272 RepID=UPI003A67506E|nr:MAG: HD domain-containing protein [Candidatus Jettenia sp. AMX2]
MQQYVEISKDILVEGVTIGCDVYLKSYSDGVPKYILFCRKDEPFNENRKNVLLEKNIEKLYVIPSDSHKCLIYQERNLSDILASNTVNFVAKSQAIYHTAKNLTKGILQNVSLTDTDFHKVDYWVKHTLGFVLNDENAFSGLIRMTSHDYYTYTHLVNVAVYGLLFGKYLGLPSENLNTLGKGMLLHDVGKVDTPLGILNKAGKLTKDEFGIIMRHPEAGYNLLKDKKDINGKPLIPIIQHHENYDGTGYPYGIGGEEIDLNGRISRIIDTFDAMTTNRCYAKARNPFEALSIMKECMKNHFDMELFREFICFLGSGKILTASGKKLKTFH